MYDRWRSLVVVFGWLCSYVHWVYTFYRSVRQPVVLTSLNGRPPLMFGPVCSYCIQGLVCSYGHTGAGMLILSYRGWYAHMVIYSTLIYCSQIYAGMLTCSYTTFSFHLFTLIYNYSAGILDILHSDCNTVWSMCHMYKHFGHCYTTIYGHCYTSIYGYSTQALWLPHCGWQKPHLMSSGYMQ